MPYEDLTFAYGLSVIVPALNNYKYRILEVSHALDGYPLHLAANRPPISDGFADEEAFEAAVAKILSSPELRSALSVLKSQVVKG